MYNPENIKFELPYYQEVLKFYKINTCLVDHLKNLQDLFPVGQSSSQLFCFKYHHLSERRRPVFDEENSTIAYQPVKCPSMGNPICPNGDLCQFAHTDNEIAYHPLIYKTEACQGCPYDSNTKFCSYFHSDEISRKVILEKFIAKVAKDAGKGLQGMPSTDQVSNSLETFKTRPCTFKGNHNPKVCEYYHHDQDRKRSTKIFHYTPNMCPWISSGEVCPKGDNCEFCHNKVEQLYHPERYKRKFCLSHPHNVHKCEYGGFCSFAHNENEIQIELLHNLKKDEDFYLYKYKAVFCPYIYDHDRNQCVYAHNPQDFRRSPKNFNYEPAQCPYWSQRQIYSYEEGNCPKGMQCEYCHGWKELEYHPLSYKTKPCNTTKKCNKKDCSFYHTSKERRDVKPVNQVIQNLPGTQAPVQKTNVIANQETDYKTNFESMKVMFPKKKESPFYKSSVAINSIAEETRKEDSIPGKMEGFSTRPSSNISSIQFLKEELESKETKKKKTKAMSMQNKSENFTSPVAAKSDKVKEQPMKEIKSEQKNWENNIEDVSKGFDAIKISKLNDSLDLFQSYTVEKNITTSDKSNDIANQKFLKNLFSNLEKKGLEYTLQYFKAPGIDVELLKNFNQEDFNQFPQIKTEDKEKIVKIVQDVLEGEDILYEINTIHKVTSGFPTVQVNIEEIDTFEGFGANEDNNTFNNYGFFQRYSY